LILQDYDWETTPDRDIDFKRTYSKRFYDFAIRKVYNEYYFYKNLKQKRFYKALLLKIKSLIASVLMAITK